MSPSINRLLTSLYLTFVFLYLLSPLGATFNGVVVPDTHMVTFGLMAISLGLWGFVRWRKGWRWHRTSFDLIFVFWLLSFVISVLTNMDTLRRSMIGLWYMLLYIGVWYALHDMLSNGGVTRQQLIDALLYAGTLVILFSYVQIAVQYGELGQIAVPVSIIGNPNALGAILLGLTPFAVQRALTSVHLLARVGWGLYSLVVIINLFLTLSRGAWLGMFGSLGVLGILLMLHYDLLSVSSLNVWWQQRTKTQKRGFISMGLFTVLVTIIAGGLLINSFSIPARRSDLRTRLWNSALMQFSEKPITGQGFYTFGHDYPLSIQIPNAQSHAHAHSVPFNILAEMGLIGLGVFVLTVFWVVRLVVKRWQILDSKERLIYIPAIATLIGFGIQHLFDLPAMMPAVALVGLLVLVVVCAPDTPQPMSATWRKIGHSIGMIVLWVGLLTTGVWSSNIYQQYLDAMRISFGVSDDGSEADRLVSYATTAEQLNAVIVQDPMLPVYHQQQAFVWGLIANAGDAVALDNGILAYQRFLDLEPNHSISWANLSALYWQADDADSAIEAINQSLVLAPSYALYQDALALYLGEREPQLTSLPSYRYTQDFSRFEFLREPLPQPFLPQLGQ